MTHTIEDAFRAVDAMREGALSLRRACKVAGITKRAFFDRMREAPELAEAYAAARPEVAEAYAERSLHAVERAWATVLDPSVDAKRTNAVASAGRNLSDRLAWIAGRIDPERWGDSVRHSGAIQHNHAVVMLPPLAQLTPPQRVSATATLALGDDASALARLGDASSGDAGRSDSEGAGVA